MEKPIIRPNKHGDNIIIAMERNVHHPTLIDEGSMIKEIRMLHPENPESSGDILYFGYSTRNGIKDLYLLPLRCFFGLWGPPQLTHIYWKMNMSNITLSRMLDMVYRGYYRYLGSSQC